MTSGPVHIRCPAPTYQPVLRVLEICFKSNMERHADMAMTVMKEEGYTHRSLEKHHAGPHVGAPAWVKRLREQEKSEQEPLLWFL